MTAIGAFGVGEAACLGAAALWAVSVNLFRRPIGEHGARTVNLVKCTLAALLQSVTIVLLGETRGYALASASEIGLVAASGIVGLTLGDTALFASVARIGVSRTLLLQTLAPVFAAGLAFAVHGERLATRQLVGALLVLAGVGLVVRPDRSAGPAGPAALERGGTALGILAAACQGSGIVMAKAGMATLGAMPASALRIAAAALGLIAIALVQGRARRALALLRSRDALARVVPATLLGTYVALFLMMAGVALAPASIAAVLLSTSPVFALAIDAAIERRPPPLGGIAGTVLAIVGVAVLSAGS